MTETLLEVRPLSVDESWTFKTQQMHVAGLPVAVWKREPALQPVRSVTRSPGTWTARTCGRGAVGTGGTRSARGNLESSARRCSGSAAIAAAAALAFQLGPARDVAHDPAQNPALHGVR